MKANKSCSAAITSKVSLPLTTVLLAGIAHNMACFLAIRFYDALMNWAISIHSQKVCGTTLFVLLEKSVLGGRCVGGRAGCSAVDTPRPTGTLLPGACAPPPGEASSHCRQFHRNPRSQPGLSRPSSSSVLSRSACFPSPCADQGATTGEGLWCHGSHGPAHQQPGSVGW